MDGARFIFGSLYSALQLVGAIGAVGTNVTVLEEDLKKKLLLALSLLLEHADPMLIVSKNSEDGELDLEAIERFTVRSISHGRLATTECEGQCRAWNCCNRTRRVRPTTTNLLATNTVHSPPGEHSSSSLDE